MLPHIFYFVNTVLENFLKYFFKTAQKNISTQKENSKHIFSCYQTATAFFGGRRTFIPNG